MEKIRKPRIEQAEHNITDLWRKSKGNTMEQNLVFSKNGAGTTGIHMQKNDSRHRPYILQKNQFKIDHTPKCKMQTKL